MYIAQLTDLHVVEPGALGHSGVDSTSHIVNALERLAALSPAPNAVVLTGDLADHGNVGEYTLLRRMLDTLPMPVYLAVGNHDNREHFLEVFGDAPYLAGHASFIQYRQNLGALDLLVLDTLEQGRITGHYCEARLAWLEEDLARHAGRPTLVAMHHPPVESLSQLELFEKGGNWFGKMIAALNAHGNVVGVLAGHTHRSASTLADGIPLLVGPATCGYQADYNPDWSRLDVTLSFEAPTMFLHRFADARLTSYLVPAMSDYPTLRPAYADVLEKMVMDGTAH